MGNDEYISLVGQYNNIVLKPTNDIKEISNKGYSPEAIAELHKAMGTTFPEIRSMNLIFKTDLNKFEYPLFNSVMTLFHKYDNFGTLPFSGCHADQPAQIMEIFNILESLRSEDEKRVSENVRS